MEESLTMHRLGVPPQFRRKLGATNAIESAFSIVETVCRLPEREAMERWGIGLNDGAASGLLVAETQFRKVIGYPQIPTLIVSREDAISK